MELFIFFFVENIRQTTFVSKIFSSVTFYILIRLCALLQDIHLSRRNNQIYLVAHYGTEI
jgi:hypothetical protein